MLMHRRLLDFYSHNISKVQLWIVLWVCSTSGSWQNHVIVMLCQCKNKFHLQEIFFQIPKLVGKLFLISPAKLFSRILCCSCPVNGIHLEIETSQFTSHCCHHLFTMLNNNFICIIMLKIKIQHLLSHAWSDWYWSPWLIKIFYILLLISAAQIVFTILKCIRISCCWIRAYKYSWIPSLILTLIFPRLHLSSYLKYLSVYINYVLIICILSSFRSHYCGNDVQQYI